MLTKPPALALAATMAFACLPLAATLPAISPAMLADELVVRATLVLQRAVAVRPAAIPASIMMRAQGLAVFPQARRAGSRYSGDGVISARGASPTSWTPPAVIALGATIPLELDSDEVDFVVIAQTARGMDYLTFTSLANPAGLPIAPGALGHDSRTRLDADLLAYMQFGDYFAGVTLRDWTISEVRDANAQLYGRAYSTDDVLRRAGFFRLPPAAQSWRNVIAGYFREAS